MTFTCLCGRALHASCVHTFLRPGDTVCCTCMKELKYTLFIGPSVLQYIYIYIYIYIYMVFELMCLKVSEFVQTQPFHIYTVSIFKNKMLCSFNTFKDIMCL
jgi:hypothetical protein